jgi:hypothetical protein
MKARCSNSTGSSGPAIIRRLGDCRVIFLQRIIGND